MDVNNVNAAAEEKVNKNSLSAAGKLTAKILYYAVAVILSLVILINAVMFVQSYMLKSSSPGIFGFRPLAILSGSMSPKIKYGDLILIKSAQAGSIKKNDVITYRLNENILISHRVVEVIGSNGSAVFKTQGDANNVSDSALVSAKQILGKCVLVIPYLGYVSIFGSSPQGGAVLVMAPLLLFFVIIETVKFVKKTRETRILKITD